MVDISSIRSELSAPHPVTGAYSPSDEAAAAELNAKNVPKLVPIPSSELLAWSAQASTGGRPRKLKIDEAATAHLSEAVKAVAQAAQTMIERDSTSLDLSQTDRAAMVEALVAGGVLTTADKDSLYAAATVMVSRADELGIGRVRVGDVARARSQN